MALFLNLEKLFFDILAIFATFQRMLFRRGARLPFMGTAFADQAIARFSN